MKPSALAFGLALALAAPAAPWPSLRGAEASTGQFIERTREQVRDRIHGGWVGMLIGGIEGLAHEFKYIDQPRQELPEYPLLPQGARSDDDNDIEWVHLYFMDKEQVIKLPYPRLVEIWKANMNQGVWCANERARKLMDQGLAPPRTSQPALNPFSSYNLAGQFTVESYGMIAPGMPQTAADIGLHYARIAVSGEPLQAAQFWTTLISLAAVSEEPLEELLKRALQAVDPASAQAEAIREAIEQFHANPEDWKAARRHFHAKWFIKMPGTAPGKWNDNSTPLNGAMVALALLYGHGDFYKTGQYAMALGYDADCNAATACAVVGTRVGFQAIAKLPNFRMPDRYVNLTRPQLPGECKISEQVDTMLRISERVILAGGGGTATIGGKAGYRIRLEAPRPLVRS
jgi:ADP-ribosylglycohydrolase